MKKLIVVLLIIFILLLCCAMSFGSIYLLSESISNYRGDSGITLEYYSGDEDSTNKILLLKINGTIIDTRDQVPAFYSSGYVFGYEVKELLYDAALDEDIKGVLIAVNSGGGTVLGSRAIVDGINYYKETTENPVYGYVQGFAASGAYMALSACDYITADYGSMTGSIGVIFGTPFQYYDKVMTEGYASGEYIATQNGIETFYISAGESKDIGNPYRKMTAEELESLQSNIDVEYNQFVKLVSGNRDISEIKIKNEIKALIYGNTQAITLGLIDKQATYDETLALLTEDLEDYQVVTTTTDDFWTLLMQSTIKKNEIDAISPLQNRLLLIYGDPTMYD